MNKKLDEVVSCKRVALTEYSGCAYLSHNIQSLIKYSVNYHIKKKCNGLNHLVKGYNYSWPNNPVSKLEHFEQNNNH